MRIIRDKVENKPRGFGFILFKSRKGVENVFRDGDIHQVKTAVIECRKTLLRGELKKIKRETEKFKEEVQLSEKREKSFYSDGLNSLYAFSQASQGANKGSFGMDCFEIETRPRRNEILSNMSWMDSMKKLEETTKSYMMASNSGMTNSFKSEKIGATRTEKESMADDKLKRDIYSLIEDTEDIKDQNITVETQASSNKKNKLSMVSYAMASSMSHRKMQCPGLNFNNVNSSSGHRSTLRIPEKCSFFEGSKGVTQDLNFDEDEVKSPSLPPSIEDNNSGKLL